MLPASWGADSPLSQAFSTAPVPAQRRSLGLAAGGLAGEGSPRQAWAPQGGPPPPTARLRLFMLFCVLLFLLLPLHLLDTEAPLSLTQCL